MDITTNAINDLFFEQIRALTIKTVKGVKA